MSVSPDDKSVATPASAAEIRDWTATEAAALSTGYTTVGMSDERGAEVLGRAVDVYLNDATFWRGVPEAVWNYHIGGYQILKKWLSYREETILGRPLVKDEAREFTAMVRRISAIVLMTDVLDSNYMAVRDASIALSTANPVSVPQIEDPQATGAESAPI